MRNSLLIIIFVAIFQLSAFAQSTPEDPKTSNCPTFKVRISPELMQPGETATATLETEKAENLDLKFDWKVENGEITTEQDTRKLIVRAINEGNLTVTVNVKGLPENCNSSVSATSSIYVIGCRLPLVFDDYPKETLEREKARLDNFAAQIIIDKTNVGLLLLTLDTTNQAKINSRIKKVFSYLNGVRKIESSRLKFALSADERQRTQLYVFPQDSVFVPDFYKLISDEDLAKITSPQISKRRKSR